MAAILLAVTDRMFFCCRSTPPTLRSHGSAETGFLQRHYTSPSNMATPTNHTSSPRSIEESIIEEPDHPSLGPRHKTTPSRPNHTFNSPRTAFSPLSRQINSSLATPTSHFNNQALTPSMGVAGGQRSHTPRSAFPLNVQEDKVNHSVPSEGVHSNAMPSDHASVPRPSDAASSGPLLSSQPATPPTLPLQPVLPPSSLGRVNLDGSPHIRARALSIFEEESETESIPDHSPQTQSRQVSASPSHPSPSHHPSSPHIGSPRVHSRKLSNARSSPNIFASISKSDISEEDEEEDDDDIVELMTTSGRFPSKTATFPRTSPSSSPLLTSRCSPTHYLTGGSSEEEAGNVFETARKNRSKRHPYRKRSIPKLVRVDSISSDDGKSPRDQAPPTRKGRLLRLRQYNSLPATPAEHSASESLTDILESLRKRQPTTSSNVSGRTDSSVSDGAGSRGTTGDRDMGELASSIVARFELSDEDALQNSMELEANRAANENQQRKAPGVKQNRNENASDSNIELDNGNQEASIPSCPSLPSMDVSSALVQPRPSTLRSVVCCVL